MPFSFLVLVYRKEGVQKVIIDSCGDDPLFVSLNTKKSFSSKMEVPPNQKPEGDGFFVHSIYHGSTLFDNEFGRVYSLKLPRSSGK